MKKALLAAAVLFSMLGAGNSYAQVAGRGSVSTNDTAVTRRSDEIQTKADFMDYDERTGWVRARGGVDIRKGTDRLQADYVVVNLKTEQVHAKGNVILRRGNAKPVRGEELKGNFGTGAWEWMGVRGALEGVTLISSEKLERRADESFLVYQGKVTTCSNAYPNCHYHVRARKIEVMPGDYMKVRGATWYFGSVPFFYLPYWHRDLEEGGFNFRVGHNSRWGNFGLLGYEYRLNEALRAETHLDYYEKRGVGAGQDFMWRSPSNYTGSVEFYYVSDQEPVDEEEDAEELGIEDDRYRVRLKHHYDFSPQDYLMLEAQYVSDINFREDFFRSEYRLQRTPENYATYTHRDDRYTLTIDSVFRLNDFYTSVNRLPEASLEFMRQPIGDSFYYYEGETAVAYLEKLWPESNTNAVDYSAFRIDTSHMVYRPQKYFRFLNVVPRGGFRGTYFSATKDTLISTNIVTTISTNTVTVGAVTSSVVNVSSATNLVETEIESGAEFRSLVQLGCEVSFKAFRTWEDPNFPLRHIVEPYANYTFVPEPSVLPENLYQFDSVDTLSDQNTVRLGVRNKWQTKRRRKKSRYVWELVDLNTYTIANLDPGSGEDVIENLYFTAEITPSQKLDLETRGIWNLDDGELSRFDVELDVKEKAWEALVDYRYRTEDSSLLYGKLRLLPSSKWNFDVYSRYEFEDRRQEETGVNVWRKFDCMVFKLGTSMIPAYMRSNGVEREDEYSIVFEWWLTAFPQYMLQ